MLLTEDRKTLVINLLNGFEKNPYFDAFKFPGGEVHFKFNQEMTFPDLGTTRINVRLNTSDDIMLLMQVVEAIRHLGGKKIEVFIPYFPYQQADRRFSENETFSLKVFANILNSLELTRVYIFDPHSDVSPALINNSVIIDNAEYVKNIVLSIYGTMEEAEASLTLLSPDAGAFKKIFKLADKIGFKGQIVTANKSRDHETGNLVQVLDKNDFSGKDVMIIDDLTIASGTHLGLYSMIKDKNIGNAYLTVSHMINQDPRAELNGTFTQVFTTNSRFESYNLPNIEVYDLFNTPTLTNK